MPLLNDANAVLLGTNPVDSVYLGDIKVWPSGPEVPFTDTFRMTFGDFFVSSYEPPTSPGVFNIGVNTGADSYLVFITLPNALDLDGKPIYDAVASPAWQTEVAAIWDPVSTLILPGAFGPSYFADGGDGKGLVGFQSFWIGAPSFFVQGREYVFGVYDRADTTPSIWEGRYRKRFTSSETTVTINVGEVWKINQYNVAPDRLFFNLRNDEDLDGNIGVWRTLDAVTGLDVQETECVFEMTNLSSSDVWSSRITTYTQSDFQWERSLINFEDDVPDWNNVDVYCRLRLER